jgi:hypothetical protein
MDTTAGSTPRYRRAVFDEVGAWLGLGVAQLVAVLRRRRHPPVGPAPERGPVMSIRDAMNAGHLDPDGAPFATGRADDMIVSGGESVYADQVEHLIRSRRGRETAMMGVEDR